MGIVTTKDLLIRELSLRDAQRIFEFSREKSLRENLPEAVFKDLDEARSAIKFFIE